MGCCEARRGRGHAQGHLGARTQVSPRKSAVAGEKEEEEEEEALCVACTRGCTTTHHDEFVWNCVLLCVSVPAQTTNSSLEDRIGQLQQQLTVMMKDVNVAQQREDAASDRASRLEKEVAHYHTQVAELQDNLKAAERLNGAAAGQSGAYAWSHDTLGAVWTQSLTRRVDMVPNVRAWCGVYLFAPCLLLRVDRRGCCRQSRGRTQRSVQLT